MSQATALNIAEHHLFNRLGKTILFNGETMLFYEVTPLVFDLMTLLAQDSALDNPVRHLQEKYSEEEIQQAVFYLRQEQFIRDAPTEKPKLVRRRGIRHLELMVTHDCNMRCRYCYGVDDGGNNPETPYLYGSDTCGMSFETAQQGVDFLFDVSGPQKELSVIFFGGEPLLELELIQKITQYIRSREEETGKKVRLSLATNGLLLSKKSVDFLVRNNISCQVSMDGSRSTHNSNRLLCSQKGSYDAVLPGIKCLQSARPGKIPVRATLSHGNLNLLDTIHHLHELGFGSIHVEPAIGGQHGIHITEDDVPVIQEQHEEVAEYLVQCASDDRYFNYTNLVKFIRHTSVVQERQAHYCGAARTYLALAQDGSFYPCHRFVGNKEYQMGNITKGVDDSVQKTILGLSVDDRPICSECWARYLCGGGCWHNAVTVNGTLTTPDDRVGCRITRHLVECAMAVSSDLQEMAKSNLNSLYETSTEPYLVAERQQQEE